MSVNTKSNLLLASTRKRFSSGKLNHSVFVASQINDASNMSDQATDIVKANNTNIRVIEIEPEKGKNTIGIDSLQELKKLMNYRSDNLHLLIKLDHAGQLTEAAQNSLLKVLEEQQSTVTFFFAVTSTAQLLPTVLSRCEIITYKPTVETDLSLAEQKLLRASGFAKTILASYQDDKTLDLAKSWITASPIKRIVINQDLKTQKQAERLVENLAVIVYAMLIDATASSQDKMSRLIKQLEQLEKIMASISNGGNIKLCLAQAALTI